MPLEIDIREFVPADAEQVVALYNRFGYGSASWGFSLTADDLLRSLVERGTHLFLIASYGGSIVGTMGFFSISGQKAADPDAIWAGSFFIHPEFRRGQIPGIMFTRSIAYMTEQGIKYLDSEVSPENLSALALYKRVGLFRTSRSYVDYDGYLELRSYLPYVLSYFNSVLRLAGLNGNVSLSSGWRDLFAPANLRSLDRDSFIFNGVEVVKYDLRIDKERIIAHVDVFGQEIVAIQMEEFQVSWTVTNRQSFHLQQDIDVICEFTNKSKLERSLAIYLHQSVGQQVLVYEGLVKPRQNLRKVITTQFETTGKKMIRGEIVLDAIQLPVGVGVTVSAPLEVEMPMISALVAGRDYMLSGRVINREEVMQVVRLRVADAKGVEVTIGTEPLHVPGNANVPIKYTIRAPEHEGVYRVDWSLESQSSGVVFCAKSDIPVRQPTMPIAFCDEREALLENSVMQVRVHQENGLLIIRNPLTGEVVIQEPWSDVGPPYINGIKKSISRSLCTTCQNDAARSELIVVEERDEYTLTKKLALGQDGLLHVEQHLSVSTRDCPTTLKVNSWCSLNTASIIVPLRHGLLKTPLNYEEFPFSVHDYEALRGRQMPYRSEELLEEWTVFEAENQTVGLLWNGADEFRFGLHWMPSLVFADKHHEVPFNRKIRYSYYIGAGGIQHIRALWVELYGSHGRGLVGASWSNTMRGRYEISVQKCYALVGIQRVHLSGTVSTLLEGAHSGVIMVERISTGECFTVEVKNITKSNPQEWEIEFLHMEPQQHARLVIAFVSPGCTSDVFVEVEEPSHERVLSIEETSRKFQPVHVIRSAFLEAEVAPEYNGGLVSLRFGGLNLLRCAFSKHLATHKVFGQHPIWLGGIYPQLIDGQVDLQRGVIVIDREDMGKLKPSSVKVFRSEDRAGLVMDTPLFKNEVVLLRDEAVLRLLTVRRHSVDTRRQTIAWNLYFQPVNAKFPITFYFFRGDRWFLFTEGGVRNKIYSNRRAIIRLGSNMFVSVAVNQSDSQIAAYEWPGYGMQIVVFIPLSDQLTNSTYWDLSVSQSFEEALAQLNKMGGYDRVNH